MSDSSVSTTSSRIKQFGLYRTIDARTEEFLRLSRKRQLRQGCACAAVSTTITVTIVVSVILIYEYGINSEFSPKSTLKSNWLGLMNTNETIPFEAKFNKASINIESSIRLLPLILKALKKNRYYDNIMEDDSSPNPLYGKKETDEFLTKNIFSDTRNGMRIPASRIYAIEYKTSPIVYYKNPTFNTDYFTKVRRIRDYQRIMNYVDKMISEKITGSTMPMIKSTYVFDKKLPIPYTTPMMNYKTKHNLQDNTKELIIKKKKKCSCPKKMNDLLNKMITVLQKLLPNATQDISKMPKPCDHSHKKITNDVTESSQTPIEDDVKSKIIFKKVENSNELFQSNKSFEASLPTSTKGKVKQVEYLLNALPPKVDYTLQTIIRLIKPKKLRGNAIINDLNLHKPETVKLPESTEDYFSPEDKTKTLPVFETTSHVSPISVTPEVTNIGVSEDLFYTKHLKTLNISPTTPTFVDVTDNKYFVNNTSPEMKDRFNSLDVHSLELIKSKIVRNKIKLNAKVENSENNEQSKLYNDNSKMFKNGSLIWGLLRKMEQLVKSKSIKSDKTTKEPIDNVTKMNNISYETTDYLNSVDSIPPHSETIQYFTTTPIFRTHKNDFTKTEQDLPFKSEDVTLEYEEEKSSYEEAMTSNNVKKLEKIINLFNNSQIIQNNTNINIPLYQWENINFEDNKSIEETTKLIIPKIRSSYLEIQRNDWKHEEHQDYDNTINNY